MKYELRVSTAVRLSATFLVTPVTRAEADFGRQTASIWLMGDITIPSASHRWLISSTGNTLD
jgi:hypothetical protein